MVDDSGDEKGKRREMERNRCGIGYKREIFSSSCIGELNAPERFVEKENLGKQRKGFIFIIV